MTQWLRGFRNGKDSSLLREQPGNKAGVVPICETHSGPPMEAGSSTYRCAMTVFRIGSNHRAYGNSLHHTCPQDVRFLETTDPSFWHIVIVSSENELPESIDDTLKKFWLSVVEEQETPLPDQNVTCMGVYVMKDMEKDLTVKGWNKLPEKTNLNACIELELQLSWLREHSSSEDVAPMIFNKDIIRKNYDGGVSQLSLVVLERKDFRVKPWEFWTVLQESQNPQYEQLRLARDSETALLPDTDSC
ncbi:hypothetical protein BKA93DRAFT_822430 [Sparassis latifolia]